MNNKPKIFFGIALTVMALLSIMVLSPFLITLSLSIVVAVLVNPAYKKITKFFWKNKSVGSLVTIILLYVLIFLPITFISIQLFSEVQNVYTSLGTPSTPTVSGLNQMINEGLKPVMPNANFHVETYIGNFSSWLISYSGSFFTGTFDVFLKILIVTISLFFLLRDGDKFQKTIKELIPVSSEIYDYLVNSIKSAVNSVIFGSIVIAMIQGALSGIGLAIFGVPNAVLWGLIATLASFIPTIGAGIIFAPIIIYTFFTSTSFQVIGLLLWSTLIVGMVDNLLRPVIMQKSINLHPLLVLFSVLGGIGFIGPAGVILGPLTLSLLFALMRAYKLEKFPVSK